MKRIAMAALAAVGLWACGGSGGGGDSAWGTASATGPVGSQVNTPIIQSIQADGGFAGGISVSLAHDDGEFQSAPACKVLQLSPAITGEEIDLSVHPDTGSTLTTGTYAVNPSCSSNCSDVARARLSVWNWVDSGNSYSGSSVAEATSGTAQITELSSDHVAGSFAVTLSLADGGTGQLSGTFSGVYCGNP